MLLGLWTASRNRSQGLKETDRKPVVLPLTARWFWAYSFPFWSILSSSVKQSCCFRFVPVHGMCECHPPPCLGLHQSSLIKCGTFFFPDPWQSQDAPSTQCINNYSQRVGGGMWHATHFLSLHHGLRFGELLGLNACPVKIWEVNSFRHCQVKSVPSFFWDLLPFAKRLTQWLKRQQGSYVNPAEGPKRMVPRKV